MIAVGIDVGKRAHEAWFPSADGREVARPLRFANTSGGVRLLRARLPTLAEPATLALEASGHDWLGRQRALVQRGLAVEGVNPRQTHGLRTARVRKTRTDRRDALGVATLVRSGRARANSVPDETILPLRALTRCRRPLVDQIRDAKRRILGVRDRVFPAFADHFRDPCGPSARALPARAASAAAFAALDLDELATLLQRASRQRFGRDTAQAIQRRAADSRGRATLGAAARLEIQALLAQVRLREAQVDAAIAPLLAPLDQHLTTIPGVGDGAGRDPPGGDRRHRSLPRPGTLRRPGPRVFESGRFQGKRQPLAKRGSPSRRRALSLATHSAHRRNPDLDASLQRTLAEGKPYKAALVATAQAPGPHLHAPQGKTASEATHAPSHELDFS